MYSQLVCGVSNEDDRLLLILSNVLAISWPRLARWALVLPGMATSHVHNTLVLLQLPIVGASPVTVSPSRLAVADCCSACGHKARSLWAKRASKVDVSSLFLSLSRPVCMLAWRSVSLSLSPPSLSLSPLSSRSNQAMKGRCPLLLTLSLSLSLSLTPMQ